MGYLGSKGVSGAYQAIIALMPPHDTYIETHLGSGVVLRRKPPCARTIGIDIDAQTLADFKPPYPMDVRESDAVNFLESFDFSDAGRVLVYADPPYLHSTRTSRHRYRHEYTEADHERLLRTLRELPVAVLLSGYPSSLYDDMLPDWRSVSFQAMTRGGARTEKVWMNFDRAGVHWATFAGKDFTDRQRIKRKAARWAANFAALPPAERVAVLAALLEASETPAA
ncbi:DNA adenine methylase [Xanthomonas oryzae]